MKYKLKTLVLFTVMLFGSVSVSYSQYYHEGHEAYYRGDYAEALRIWGQFAEQGHAGAQLNLGLMYRSGKGVIQDYVLAHMWFNLAASNGFEAAVRYRDITAERMSSAQIAKAQQMARDFEKRLADEGKRAESTTEIAKTETDVDLEKLYEVGAGSGFFITADGYAITNHHVVEGCQENKVHVSNNTYETKVLAIDKVNDLALLETNSQQSEYFVLYQGQPKLMQEVFVAGFPITDVTNTTVKVTKGIVSSLAGMDNDFGSFMMDAALQPGNSGGPIFNDDGELIGVAMATISKDYADEAGFLPQNVNFGIKSETVKNFLESNQVKPAKPSWFYSPDKEELVDNATISISCWMDIPTIRQMQENNPQKLMYKLPID